MFSLVEKMPILFCVARRGCSGVNDMVLHILGGGSRELPLWILILEHPKPGLRVTVFDFLGSGYNDSLFHRQCSEDWLMETYFGKWND